MATTQDENHSLKTNGATIISYPTASGFDVKTLSHITFNILFFSYLSSRCNRVIQLGQLFE